MALQRRLLVGLGTASSLLLLYLLCLNLQLSTAPFRSLAAGFGSDPPSGRQDWRRDPTTANTSTARRTTLPTTTPAETTPAGTTSAETTPAETTPAETTPAETTPAETTPAETTPAETTPAETTPAETTPAETTPAETTPAETTSAETTPVRVQTSKPGLHQTGPGPTPTAPSFLGDSYYREDVAPLTACPVSVRRLVPLSVFGSRFRPDVPVLQWSKHLSPEEYHRLQQYPGAHGWGGVSYQTLADSLSCLDSSAGLLLDQVGPDHTGSECIRCAVVGNGGILKGSRKGPEIDQHHYVFRVNGAIIKGFEADVGSRTTHYVFSTNTLRNSLRAYRDYTRPPQGQETRYVFLPDHDRDYLLLKAAATGTKVQSGKDQDLDPVQLFGSDATKKLKMFHPDFIRYLRNRFLRSKALNTKYKDLYRPSTGAVMLLSAMHSCDQVSAYGFMTPEFSRFSDHYFDKSFHAVGFFINHDLRLELLLWQQLHQAGLIRLYMRPDQDQDQNQV
ncbi:unnamed protein product [Knipowitschia caucasica]